MKRNLLVILACALIALCVISCDNHTHSYSDKWSSDATNHWHECECGAKKDEAAHTFESWTVEGTNEKSTCSVCRYEATREISKWDGKTYDISWYDPNDETKTEYTLTTANQLAGLAMLVNGGTDETQLKDIEGKSFDGITIKLACNINLGDYQWTPIGLYHDINDTDKYKKKPFSGTFDGQGHTIIGLKIESDVDAASYRALFGYADGTIKNFTVKGKISACDAAGVVAALGDGGVVDSVINYADVSTSGAYVDGTNTHTKLAGIVVATKTGEKGCTIRNCTNYGDITSTSKEANDGIGGILAWNAAKILTIEGCTNEGNVTGEGQDAGGIVGTITGSEKALIKNCTNKGTIKSNKDGNIIGNIYAGAKGSIQNCTPTTDPIGGGSWAN